jgi:hypothetical protein
MVVDMVPTFRVPIGRRVVVLLPDVTVLSPRMNIIYPGLLGAVRISGVFVALEKLPTPVLV